MTRYLTVFFMLMATAASAQQLSMSDKMELRNNCGPDIRALCPGIRPGGGQLMTCIKAKQGQLSKVCSDTIAKMAAKKPD